MIGRFRRRGSPALGRALMAIWVILPLFPLLGLLYSWLAGVA